MTQKLKRYQFILDYDSTRLEDSDTGEYVKYEDYEKLQAQLEKAENCLKLISAPQCDYRTFEAETVERLIECFVADTDCAREYFKEKGQV